MKGGLCDCTVTSNTKEKEKTVKRIFKKRISLLLAVVILFLCLPGEASASESVSQCPMNRIYGTPDYDNGCFWDVLESEENARSLPELTNCSVSCSYSSQGMHVEIYTTCSHQSEEVGVKDVKIQKQVGIFWSTVATSTGGSCADSIAYGGSLLYTGAEYGATYRVSCVHFAYCGGYDLQSEHVTGGSICTY